MFAPQSQPLFGFELRHSEQVSENIEPVAPGQQGQFGYGLRDEGHSLVRAALPACFFRFRSPFPARSSALPAPRLRQSTTSKIELILLRNTPFAAATLARSSQLLRYKVVSDYRPPKTQRFDRGRPTTHVRFDTVDRESRGTAFKISRKLLATSAISLPRTDRSIRKLISR
jgi:hypothetical protein